MKSIVATAEATEKPGKEPTVLGSRGVECVVTSSHTHYNS